MRENRTQGTERGASGNWRLYLDYKDEFNKDPSLKKIPKYSIEDLIKQKAWSVTTILLSQYDIETLKHPIQEYWCIFENQFQENFENYFFKELIELMGFIRATLDIHEIAIDFTVGMLVDYRGRSELSFREACNKTIHSKEYEIRFDHSQEHPLSLIDPHYNDTAIADYKNPIIITSGDFHGKNWTAEINFLKFIHQAVNLPVY